MNLNNIDTNFEPGFEKNWNSFRRIQYVSAIGRIANNPVIK